MSNCPPFFMRSAQSGVHVVFGVRVCLSTTAFDWIDLDYCKDNNIVVCNIPKYSTDSVAEYGVFLMMGLAKMFPIQVKTIYQLLL